jgi:hypothetical protein
MDSCFSIALVMVATSVCCNSQPAAAICELVKPDDGAGGMARRDDMVSFCTAHRIPSITIRQMQVRCAVVAHGHPTACKTATWTGITVSTHKGQLRQKLQHMPDCFMLHIAGIREAQGRGRNRTQGQPAYLCPAAGGCGAARWPGGALQVISDHDQPDGLLSINETYNSCVRPSTELRWAVNYTRRRLI